MNASELCRRMVENQIRRRGIHDVELLSAFLKVDRGCFVPDEIFRNAYEDCPLPIGWGQTISQPYIVAFMTEKLGVLPSEKVLEIGTGSGYQAAILAELAAEVYTVEKIPELSKSALRVFSSLGYLNIHAKEGEGREGWPEFAPFDKIMVTAAAEDGIPTALIEQLREGGKIVVPVGKGEQVLMVGKKVKGSMAFEKILSVRFVPLV
ncbi:MAG TPA: protein-L-isoaspartate(D-aspartate) O-methyltransferase [Candidatus Omnitrophota bacterium]|nr:protein-L-isoaspartate(D-aspartate) O-methyltransferase [Candidatus Omnitrophota bacterium]